MLLELTLCSTPKKAKTRSAGSGAAGCWAHQAADFLWVTAQKCTNAEERCFWYLSTAMFVRVCACQGPSNRLISPQQRPPCARLFLVRSPGGTNQLLRERQHSSRWQEGNGIGVTCSVSHERVFPSPSALCIGLQPKCQMVGCCFDTRRQEDLFSLHGCVCLCNGQWGGSFLFYFLFMLASLCRKVQLNYLQWLHWKQKNPKYMNSAEDVCLSNHKGKLVERGLFHVGWMRLCVLSARIHSVALTIGQGKAC